jgi:hypothetical protein
MTNNLAAIRAAFEAAGVEFTDGDQPGVRLEEGLGPVEPGMTSGFLGQFTGLPGSPTRTRSL